MSECFKINCFQLNINFCVKTFALIIFNEFIRNNLIFKIFGIKMNVYGETVYSRFEIFASLSI
jgi:hypothetical protein